MRQEVGIEYRRARPKDLPQTASVFAIAIDDLDKKHGFFEKPTSTSPPNPQYAFWLKKEPASFWVAEDDHRIVGYSFSFLRGSLWFLADLFILPAYQGRGIGKTLIQKTLGSWRGSPLVLRSASYLLRALEATLKHSAEQQSKELTIGFAGTNEEAVLASIRHGFRIKYPLLFLSSKPMGDWDNYLFYSPGLM